MLGGSRCFRTSTIPIVHFSRSLTQPNAFGASATRGNNTETEGETEGGMGIGELLPGDPNGEFGGSKQVRLTNLNNSN